MSSKYWDQWMATRSRSEPPCKSGRAPGSKGEDLTVKYVQDQFHGLGLEPGNPDGTFLREWPVFGWEEFYTEPYLAWHAGLLWATDSFNHRVNAFDAAGKLRFSIGATPRRVTATQ